MQRTPLVAPIVGALLLGLGATACSTQERNYEIPSALCGTAVSPDLLEPFLPPGKEISMRESSLMGGFKKCRVLVDGIQVLSAGIDWREKEQSLTGAAYAAIGVDPGDKESDDGRYLYSDTGAVGEVVCPNPRRPDRRLFVTALGRGDGETGEAAMGKFIAAYAEAVGKSGECT
ncbi:hypothetical protein ACFSJS_06230 [Streptomyces desertarenae]|uniref:DUF3558 domain-containing protein n=1 Tax=Streptomyces desertarenae TaxID=2666184 RepID=A0ABW4PEW5_9ACTN